MGIRVEHTISDGNLVSIQENEDNSVERKYTDIFP